MSCLVCYRFILSFYFLLVIFLFKFCCFWLTLSMCSCSRDVRLSTRGLPHSPFTPRARPVMYVFHLSVSNVPVALYAPRVVLQSVFLSSLCLFLCLFSPPPPPLPTPTQSSPHTTVKRDELITYICACNLCSVCFVLLVVSLGDDQRDGPCSMLLLLQKIVCQFPLDSLPPSLSLLSVLQLLIYHSHRLLFTSCLKYCCSHVCFLRCRSLLDEWTVAQCFPFVSPWRLDSVPSFRCIRFFLVDIATAYCMPCAANG